MFIICHLFCKKKEEFYSQYLTKYSHVVILLWWVHLLCCYNIRSFKMEILVVHLSYTINTMAKWAHLFRLELSMVSFDVTVMLDGLCCFHQHPPTNAKFDSFVHIRWSKSADDLSFLLNILNIYNTFDCDYDFATFWSWFNHSSVSFNDKLTSNFIDKSQGNQHFPNDFFREK